MEIAEIELCEEYRMYNLLCGYKMAEGIKVITIIVITNAYFLAIICVVYIDQSLPSRHLLPTTSATSGEFRGLGAFICSLST